MQHRANFWGFSVWGSFDAFAVLLMSLLAILAPAKPALTMVILVVFFLALQVVLFRSDIFRRKK